MRGRRVFLNLGISVAYSWLCTGTALEEPGELLQEDLALHGQVLQSLCPLLHTVLRREGHGIDRGPSQPAVNFLYTAEEVPEDDPLLSQCGQRVTLSDEQLHQVG